MNIPGRLGLLAVAGLAVAGCAAWNSLVITKENCLPGIGPKEAVVVIYLDKETGMPAANPPECYVPAGGTVTFATPKGDTDGFEIRFDKGDGTPAADNDGDFKGKMQGTSGYVAEIPRIRSYNKGDPAKNKYDYTIEINGKKTDPSIIIDE